MSEADKPLINRIANSALKTINLEHFYPKQEFHYFDIKDYLFQGLLLKEKDFRADLKIHDWSKYESGMVLIFCSADAIVPVWAYMLVASLAQKAGAEVYHGNKEAYLDYYYKQYIDAMDLSQYQDQRVVVKGCSEKDVPFSAYTHLTAGLQAYAQSIMYGEPCSTVPIFKRPRKLD